jgi:Protein of unknown function (DUF3435)
MGVSEEFMRIVGPNSTVRLLEAEMSALQADLLARYGKPSNAPIADQERYNRKVNELRAARQKHRRKVEEIIRAEFFKKRNDEELERQLCGIHDPQQPLRKVNFSLPERRRIADILGDLVEDLPEDEIVRRKVDSINAWVDYAWKIEPKEPMPARSQRGLKHSLERFPSKLSHLRPNSRYVDVPLRRGRGTHG